MDRFAARLALAVAVVSIVLNAVAWKRLHAAAEPAAFSADPARPTPAPAPFVLPSQAPGLTDDDVAVACRKAMARREETVCAAVWPRVLRKARYDSERAPVMPKTIDGLLNALLWRPGDDDNLTPEQAAQRAPIVACGNNLKQIGVYMALFEAKYREYPLGWDELLKPDLATRKDLFVCPLDPPGTECSYEYIWPFQGDATPPDFVCGYDKHPHADGRFCVLLFEGRVEELGADQLRERLDNQAAKERERIADALAKARGEAGDPAATAEKRDRALKKLELLGRR